MTYQPRHYRRPLWQRVASRVYFHHLWAIYVVGVVLLATAAALVVHEARQ